ncbi:MAG: ATP-binding cassette domain-containing protein [Magnetococcales bacterium]|nr:ATP-binding cassette domain-containing protein [Magnetococcales bacterium]MBF0150064.1 ATP-binding cassette domain-containing protein [Magnetococcales bacterium]
MNATQEAIRHILATHIMFSQLPDHDKEFLQTQFGLHTFDVGAVIAEQDQPMEHFIYLHSGKVRLKRTHEGKRVSLGVLERHSSFGEPSLIQEGTWPYQIVVEESVTAFVMPVAGVRRMLPGNEDMAQLFKKEVGYLLLAQRLRGMLSDFPYRQIDFFDILHQLGVKNIAAGGVVYEQGKKDPRLYYVEKGEVVLVRQPLQGPEVVLDQVYAGALVGEGAALQDLNPEGIQPHTARVGRDVTLLVIRQEEVAKILAINPTLHEQLRLRALFLRDKEQQEIESRQRSEGVDQRVRLAAGVTEDEFRALERDERGKKGGIKTFPVVRQRASSDCGAACLTMICNHYGKEFKLGQIVELSNLSSAGVTPDSVISGAERLGFNASAYALRYDDIKGVKLPGIVGWEGSHYLVLYRMTEKKVYLVDPEKGHLKLSRQEFETGWTRAEVPGVVTEPDRGVFIALNPTLKFEYAAPPKRPIMHFVRYVLPYKKYFADALVAALLLNLLGLAAPLFTQTIVDTVVVHKDVSLLNMMLGGMILVAVLKTVTMVSQSLLLAHTTTRIDIKMMSEFYRHILALPMSFFLTRNKGEILAGFGENQKIRGIIAGSTITIILSLLMMFIYFFMMFGYSVVLTLVSMIFIPLYVGITLYFTPRMKSISQQMFLTGAKSQSNLIESLNAIESIKATANEYMARARWEDAFVDNINMGFQRQRLGLISDNLNQLVGLSSTVAILWIGATQVMEGKMTVGELMGFQMLLGMVMGPVFQVVQLWNSSQDVRIAIDRVTDILNVKPEQEPVTTPENMPATLNETMEGRIVFDKVNFSYTTVSGKEAFIMKEFELTIEPGQHIAFVGAAGCGKSTIAKMILGFNMPFPSGGTCYIDGKDVRELDLSVLRRNIGVVLQDGFLFSGTVAENIALGDPEPNLLQVKEAARLAGADEFIKKMAMGYQTQVGEKGVGVSGGQRQRICIARAIYRRPKIMLFDEATSALDNQTEALVQKNINQILTGRTSITIAHRLTTIVHSDLICFIKDGKVAEKGTHQELIDPDYLREKGYSGLYYGLAASQFGLPPLDLSSQ